MTEEDVEFDARLSRAVRRAVQERPLPPDFAARLARAVRRGRTRRRARLAAAAALALLALCAAAWRHAARPAPTRAPNFALRAASADGSHGAKSEARGLLLLGGFLGECILRRNRTTRRKEEDL